MRNNQLNSMADSCKYAVRPLQAGSEEWVEIIVDSELEAEHLVDWVGCNYDELRCDIHPLEQPQGWMVEVQPA